MKPIQSILPLLALSSLHADMVDTGADLKALPSVPSGYEVSLFAQEPLVRQTCSMAFDAKGRLCIGMGPQYRNPKPDTPGDSVVIVTDENGDGKADKTHTFATGFNAIQGLAWHGRDLWIANSPDLTVVRDIDGDDVADEYIKVFTDLGNLEHGLHGLVWAPDGRLYMSKGNSKGLNDPKNPDRIAPPPFRELFGQPTQTPATKPQTFTAATYKHTYHDPKDDWGLMGGVLRCDDMGANLEIVSRGFRNPWDIGMDDAFNWIGTDNDQNEGDRVFMPFHGAHFGWNHPWSSSWTGEDHLPTVPLSHDVFHGSGTGVTFGDLGSHHGVFFINDWLRKTTLIFKPKWNGALMQCEGGEWEPFISGGKSLFRPTDISFGPDGALYCMSWSRGYGAEYDSSGNMTSEGRVYRITAKNAAKNTLPTKPLKDQSITELISTLASPVPAQTVDAQEEIIRRGNSAKQELIAALQSDKLTTRQQTWAAWALGRLGETAFFESALQTPGNLRIQSLRILARAPLSPAAIALTKANDARTRFEAVQALWQSHRAENVPALIEVAANETDRLTFYSAWRALRDLAGTAKLKQLLTDSRGGVRRAALLALLEDGALTEEGVKPLLSDADKETRHLAEHWIKMNTGAGQKIELRGLGVNTANIAPITGTPPAREPITTPTTLEAAMAALPTADVERGRLLALHQAGAGCILCHHISGRGNQFGPDLTGIGDRADAKHLLQSILDPSAVITEGFNSHVVTTAAGTQTGVLLDESGLAVTLGLITGQRARIMRADIIKHETLPISAMPPFSAVLSAQNSADIAAWLLTQKAGAKQQSKKSDKKPDNKTAEKSPHKKDGSEVTPVPDSNPLRFHGDAVKGFCIEEHETKLRVLYNSKPVAEYVTRHPDVKRPFWMNLRNRAGVQLTRSFPPQKEEPQDHPDMHPGLWLAFGGINGTDFWRNEGRVVQAEIKDITDHSFSVTNRWLSAKGDEICRDTTTYSFSLQDKTVALHWDTKLGSTDHDITIAAQEEAGIGIRLPGALCVKTGTGHITNSNGQRDEKQCWGQPAQWWRYGTDTAAIRITPSASESSRPSWSHARDYGALVINPTGTPDAKKKPTPFTIPKGETLRLVYDVTLEN
ncbi:PVC-type heme-binding CxxCH protein [Prosthecobacter sp.]|uniref:PVC-type heme-binding CxxCH protein n=1 Tax=Prosthecobacter sp. TaxID=1965333 RepID=UPI003783D73B